MEAMLSASIREERGKGLAHRLRAQGKVPAILYGKENKKVILNAHEVQKLLNSIGRSHLITLQLKEGEETVNHPVLIKDVQVHPFKGNLLHLDLYEVSLDHKVTLKVPVVLIGQEERVNDGSLVEQLLHEVEISCLPTEIPEKIEVDISKLTMNNAISVGEITPPKGVEFVTPAGEHVVIAAAPRVETEKAVEEAEAGEGGKLGEEEKA